MLNRARQYQLHISGNLTHLSAPALQRLKTELLRVEPLDHLFIDFSALIYVDFSGAEFFVNQILEPTLHRGAMLTMQNVPPYARSVLREMTKANSIGALFA